MNAANTLEFNPQWDDAPTPFAHTWEGLINVDQFRWLVRGDMQQQLQMAVEEVGAKQVRAVGIFDEELRVLSRDPRDFRDPKAGLRRNWQLVDYCIDTLLDMGLDPMFTTTFMPPSLASGEATVFSTRGNVTMPQDMNAWCDLVIATLEHFIDRYGRERVRTWYHEVWNEPNLSAFFAGSQDDFFTLWQATYKAIKSVDAEFKIGGPSTARAEWIEWMIVEGRKESCPPDYIVGHIYNNDSETNALSPFDGPQEDQQSGSPHYADAVIRGTRALLDSLDFTGELQWNEWGRSWLASDPIRESANEGAFVVKSMAEISQCVTQLAPWCISDIYDQLGYNGSEFCGHYGLLTLHGLRKPAYNAYRLLHQLGTDRVPIAGEIEGSKCDGAIATTTATGYQALAYRFAPEGVGSEQAVPVTVAFPPGAKGLKLYRVSHSENNILHEWRQMGSPNYPTRGQLIKLHEANQLTPADDLTAQENGQVTFDLAEGSFALVTAER